MGRCLCDRFLGDSARRLRQRRQCRHIHVSVALGHMAEQADFAVVCMIGIAIRDRMAGRGPLQQHIKDSENRQKHPASAGHFPETVECCHALHASVISYHTLPGKAFRYQMT